MLMLGIAQTSLALLSLNRIIAPSKLEYMNIFEQLRSGADVDMATPEYAEAINHMTDCANISKPTGTNGNAARWSFPSPQPTRASCRPLNG